jgi:hypothetical protein
LDATAPGIVAKQRTNKKVGFRPLLWFDLHFIVACFGREWREWAKSERFARNMPQSTFSPIAELNTRLSSSDYGGNPVQKIRWLVSVAKSARSRTELKQIK